MGYFQHKHKNLKDASILKKCKHCGEEFEMRSGNQKYCHPQDNPECESDRHFQKLWDKGKHPIQLEENLQQSLK